MKRREALAGLAGLGVVGGGAAVASTDLSDSDETDPVTLETIDAPGSGNGAVSIPQTQGVLLVECFTTWCSICPRLTASLVELHERLSDRVSFVSVTNEPIGRVTTREDVAEWWAAHDGAWTVAIDAELAFTERFDVTTIPTTMIFDGSELAWREAGDKTAEELRDVLAGILDERRR
ncbi:TlpA family protein disulfide reductase (plasmid) [Haloferacaceae archaeon DSL9]